MPDQTYQPKTYRKDGGNTLVIASGGAVDVESGGKILDDGVQAAAITNAPAGGTGAAAGAYDTAANRDAMIASLNAVIAALRGAGLIAP